MGVATVADYLFTILRRWLPLAVALVVMAGLIYTAVQQDLRQSANDPQIQIAEDTARSLEHGQAFQPPTPGQVDMATSLAPWAIVYDENGRPLVSTAVLDGGIPTPPAGVFAYTRQHGEDRLTWQPRPGVRSATVMVHFGGASPGFVMAGRSLREVEQRSDQALLLAGLGCLAALAVSLGATVVFTVVELGGARRARAGPGRPA
jgi:hypothetical protein